MNKRKRNSFLVRLAVCYINRNLCDDVCLLIDFDNTIFTLLLLFMLLLLWMAFHFCHRPNHFHRLSRTRSGLFFYYSIYVLHAIIMNRVEIKNHGKTHKPTVHLCNRNVRSDLQSAGGERILHIQCIYDTGHAVILCVPLQKNVKRYGINLINIATINFFHSKTTASPDTHIITDIYKQITRTHTHLHSRK